eukprot:TRINITY_DN1164_c0_g1_i2.p1 TRINITY_DN1164_c0_g1~~TRINITY_DN1164_c0_g1_i2.p1  ORF type:complete len:881 (+),score=237.82 TRINITY_DN1164_c0_g1_i2:102-2744(+)
MSSEFNFACSKCPRTFKLEEFYEKHKKVHELKRQHVCNLCGFVYGAAKGLEGHLKTHVAPSTASKVEEVPVLGMMTTATAASPQGNGTGNYRVYDLLPDISKGAYQNGIGYYVCELCSREFSGLNSLRKHMPIHGRSIQHKCDVCGFVYGKKDYLLEHSRLHTISCDICGLLFNKASKLKDHLKVHKNVSMDGSKNESVPFRCHVCQDVYAEASELRAHLETAEHGSPTKSGSSPSYEKAVWCPLCSQGFTRHYNLKMHLYKVHGKETVENNFSAEELAGLLSSSSSSKSKDSPPTPVKRVPPPMMIATCHICSESFPHGKTSIMNHLESTHGAVLPVCRVCEDKFSDLTELKEHIESFHSSKHRRPGPASRTNASPLSRNASCQCPECGLIFSDRFALIEHAKSTYHRIPHCELCTKDFPNLADLELHQKIKHPNVNKRLQNLRDALFPEPKKMKMNVDDEDAHKAETDLIASSIQRNQGEEEGENQAVEEGEAISQKDFEEEEEVQYAPIMEDFYFEDMIVHPCYVVIPYVSDEEIEAACSISQQATLEDELDEDQGQLTIDEGSYEENTTEAVKNFDTPFTGEHENFGQRITSFNYNADDIKSESPHKGFYPDNISDYSLPFTLSGLWKKKADILGPNAMKQADLLEKQIKKINDFEKRQAERRYKKDGTEGEEDDEDEEMESTEETVEDQPNVYLKSEDSNQEFHPSSPGNNNNNNNYIPQKRKSNGELKITKQIESSPTKMSMDESLSDEMDSCETSYPESPGKGNRNKSSPHKSPDASVSKYEVQIQQNRWPVECIKCSLKLNDLQCFNIHMNDHWTGDKRCPVCRLLINSKRFNFKQHLKIHTGEKPFVCNFCKRSFRQKAHMVNFFFESIFY